MNFLIDKEDDDNIDIYADLNDTNDSIQTHQQQVLRKVSQLDSTLNDEALLFGELNSLENEVNRLRNERRDLLEENALLKTDLTSKQRQIQILKNNISSLYKTAKAELDRRSQELADLRREYDSLIFRRIAKLQNKNEIKTDDFLDDNSLPQIKDNVSTKENEHFHNERDDSIDNEELRNDRSCISKENKQQYNDYSDGQSKHPSSDSTIYSERKRKQSPLHAHNQDTNRSRSTKHDRHSPPKQSRPRFDSDLKRELHRSESSKRKYSRDYDDSRLRFRERRRYD